MAGILMVNIARLDKRLKIAAIANRLGLVATKDPKQIEFALKKIIPPDMGSDFCHRIVLFGRDICPARSPKCERCPLADGTCRRVGVTAKK